jgi:phosphoglucomutase
MTAIEKYQNWLAEPALNETLRKELLAIEQDPSEIQDRFYQDISFGTAGLRGKLGAGTNRMNIHIVARTASAIGKTILAEGRASADRGVVIAYDCRIMSPEFASLSAEILNGMGIRVYFFPSLRPTPELSYAILKLGAAAGINVTASHNPQEYNGYKVYWSDAAQIRDEIADQIIAAINKTPLFEDVPRQTREDATKAGRFIMLGQEIDEAFYDATCDLAMFGEPDHAATHATGSAATHATGSAATRATHATGSAATDQVKRDYKIVYTPLNGAGNIPVRTVLSRMGFNQVHVVPEQEQPDGTFPTTPSPNPEIPETFRLAEQLAQKIGAQLIIATDPDCDRIACHVLHQGQYHSISGNQLGILFVNYLLTQLQTQNRLPANAAIVKSIVTSETGGDIARKFGVSVYDSLTGFKNICAPAKAWEITGEHSFIIGYEESIGYSIGTHLRDKDGVGASLLLAEMTGHYLAHGRSLIDVLDQIYDEHGHEADGAINIILEGKAGQSRISRMMQTYRTTYIEKTSFAKLKEIIDYKTSIKTTIDGKAEDSAKIGKSAAGNSVTTGDTAIVESSAAESTTGQPAKQETIKIEKTDCVRYTLTDGSWYALRPSGTEPKIKIYIYTRAKTMAEANNKMAELKKTINQKLLEIE